MATLGAWSGSPGRGRPRTHLPISARGLRNYNRPHIIGLSHLLPPLPGRDGDAVEGRSCEGAAFGFYGGMGCQLRAAGLRQPATLRDRLASCPGRGFFAYICNGCGKYPPRLLPHLPGPVIAIRQVAAPDPARPAAATSGLLSPISAPLSIIGDYRSIWHYLLRVRNNFVSLASHG